MSEFSGDSSASDRIHDVVVVGAGPNGLMLACELALAGVRPLLLERLTAPTTQTRANGMVGQVVRLLDRRGLLQRLTGTDAPPAATPGFVFGGYQLRLGDLPDNPLTLLAVPQPKLEAMLGGRAEELGIEVRRGVELTGLDQDAEAVTLTLGGGQLRARYVVGADGGRSATRKLSGIGFPGVTDERTVSRTVSATIPPHLLDPATGGLLVPGYAPIPPFLHFRTERGLFIWAPFEGRGAVTTLEWDEEGVEDGEVTDEELHESITRVLGVDVELAPPTGPGPFTRRRLRATNSRLADRYREGRVFLVGDAAHVHSAIGGPGLNLGLQDSANLAWKLAATVQGWAPEGLLDSYEQERRPAAQRVTMSTQAQGVLISPGPEVTALRTLFGELLEDRTTRRRLGELLAGTDFRYEPADETGLVGRFAPELHCTVDGRRTRLAELTRTARPLLLDLTSCGDAASAWKDRVDTVQATDPDADLEGLLIRPDGYVAWAGGTGLREALTRWFGA